LSDLPLEMLGTCEHTPETRIQFPAEKTRRARGKMAGPRHFRVAMLICWHAKKISNRNFHHLMGRQSAESENTSSPAEGRQRSRDPIVVLNSTNMSRRVALRIPPNGSRLSRPPKSSQRFFSHEASRGAEGQALWVVGVSGALRGTWWAPVNGKASAGVISRKWGVRENAWPVPRAGTMCSSQGTASAGAAGSTTTSGACCSELRLRITNSGAQDALGLLPGGAK